MKQNLIVPVILFLIASTSLADDPPNSFFMLKPFEQEIEVRVTILEDTYSYTVTGNCAVDNQAITAEGYSVDGLGFNVVKDVYNGLIVYFTNNDDEWEIILDPPDDTSELEANHFSFSGDVPLNYEESDAQPMSIEVVCTAS